MNDQSRMFAATTLKGKVRNSSKKHGHSLTDLDRLRPSPAPAGGHSPASRIGSRSSEAIPRRPKANKDTAMHMCGATGHSNNDMEECAGRCYDDNWQRSSWHRLSPRVPQDSSRRSHRRTQIQPLCMFLALARSTRRHRFWESIGSFSTFDSSLTCVVITRKMTYMSGPKNFWQTTRSRSLRCCLSMVSLQVRSTTS